MIDHSPSIELFFEEFWEFVKNLNIGGSRHDLPDLAIFTEFFAQIFVKSKLLPLGRILLLKHCKSLSLLLL